MKNYPILFLLIFSTFMSHAQSKSFTLEQCDSMFQKNNLQLLAAQFDISAASARVIQAKIWEQPQVSGDFNLINPDQKRFFDIGSKGEKAIAIEQLLYIGGKKRSEIALAKTNVEIAKLQFEQLLLSLRFQLKQNFYTLYFDQRKAESLNAQLANLTGLVDAYTKQSEAGNIPLKDVVRLQSLQLALKKDLIDVQQEMIAVVQNLKLLTATETDFVPIVNENGLLIKFISPLGYTIDNLIKLAQSKNPDFLNTLKNIESSEQNLRLQKALSIPDLTVGGSWDQNGGYFKNQVNLTIGIPLPIWNKNKGAILEANSHLSQAKLLKDFGEKELEGKLRATYQTLRFEQDQFGQMNAKIRNLEQVYAGILQNFQKRNISMIEFTDFMESYNQTIQLTNELKKQYLITGETLNYLTNENVF